MIPKSAAAYRIKGLRALFARMGRSGVFGAFTRGTYPGDPFVAARTCQERPPHAVEEMRGESATSSGSDAEKIARPPGQQVVDQHEEDEQGQKRGHEADADPDQPSIEMARLLLLHDSASLELEHAIHHAPMLGQLLALSIANVAQELPDVVVALHSSKSELPRPSRHPSTAGA